MIWSLPPQLGHGVPLQQMGYPPSPDTPSQSPQDPLSQQRACLDFLSESFTKNQTTVERQVRDIRGLMDNSDWQRQRIAELEARIKSGGMFADVLRREKDRLERETVDLRSSQEANFHALEQRHVDILAQSKEEASSEAVLKAREYEQEVEKLKSTIEEAQGSHTNEISRLTTRIGLLEKEIANTAGIIAGLEDNSAALEAINEDHVRVASVQADNIESLQLALDIANSSLDQAHTELESKAWLQGELTAAELQIIDLNEANESLATKRMLDKIILKQAEDARNIADDKNVLLQAENDELRRKNILFEQADLEAMKLRKEVAGTHQKHQLREQELSQLRTEHLSLTAQVTASRKTQNEQSSELSETKAHLEKRVEEIKELQEKHQGLARELEHGQQKSASLDKALQAEKETVMKGELKRMKEQKWAAHLDGKLNVAKNASKAADKKLVDLQKEMDTKVAEAREQHQQLLAALVDVKEAEGNSTKLLQTQQATEDMLLKTNTDPEQAKQDLDKGSAKIKELDKQLEISQREPEELRRKLEDAREELKECGDKLRKSEEENKKHSEFRTKYGQLGEQFGIGLPISGTKRSHDDLEHARESSSESGQPPAKRPRTPDSTAGAPQRWDDRCSYGGSWGSGRNPNRSPLGNKSRR